MRRLLLKSFDGVVGVIASGAVCLQVAGFGLFLVAGGGARRVAELHAIAATHVASLSIHNYVTVLTNQIPETLS